MKVKELIELLLTFDPEINVMTEYEDRNYNVETECIELSEDEGKPIVLIN